MAGSDSSHHQDDTGTEMSHHFTKRHIRQFERGQGFLSVLHYLRIVGVVSVIRSYFIHFLSSRMNRLSVVGADNFCIVLYVRPNFSANPIRCNFPVGPFGISSRKTTFLGTLKSARRVAA